MVEKKRFDGSDAMDTTGMPRAKRARATPSGAVRGTRYARMPLPWGIPCGTTPCTAMATPRPHPTCNPILHSICTTAACCCRAQTAPRRRPGPFCQRPLPAKPWSG